MPDADPLAAADSTPALIPDVAPSTPATDAQSTPCRTAAPRQIVFIEADVPDFQDLIDGLKPGAQAVVRDLDQGRVQQIGAYLIRHDVQRLAGIGGPVEIHGDLAGSTSTWAARAVLRLGTSP